MKKEIISPEGVEKPRHPHVFSQGIKISGGSILFLAGQVPVDADGKTQPALLAEEERGFRFLNIS
jgi:enamine deaminase RidA (YjgF/YER057c/UK114 family)